MTGHTCDDVMTGHTCDDRSHESAEHMARRRQCTRAHLKSGDDVKVLLHVSAKNLVDGTGAPHADNLWWRLGLQSAC